MKTIYLIRHAEPQRLADVPREEWALSPKGHDMAEALKTLNGVTRVYSSPLLRAVQTARHAGLPLMVDSRLQERKTGKATPDMGDCWLRQYEDGTFKCPGGESFDEVGWRMQACVDAILAALEEEQAAIVVSHAAAMCAYLKRFCTIHVEDRLNKTREIVWQERTVYAGNLPPMAGFALRFRQGRWSTLKHCHHERNKHYGAGNHRCLHRGMPCLPLRHDGCGWPRHSGLRHFGGGMKHEGIHL